MTPGDIATGSIFTDHIAFSRTARRGMVGMTVDLTRQAAPKQPKEECPKGRHCDA